MISVPVVNKPGSPTTTDVPAGSFNIGPDETTVGTGFEPEAWYRAFTFGTTSLSAGDTRGRARYDSIF
jgi:hypothetical protein